MSPPFLRLQFGGLQIKGEKLEIREYYSRIFEKLERGFEFSHYVLAYGNDLRLRDMAHGGPPRDESALMVAVEPRDQLWDFTVNWGLEVFIPIVGHTNRAILSALDYEIYLDDSTRLYADKGSQWHYFHNYIGPVTTFIADKLEEHKIPYFTDMTPSGGHFLFWVLQGTEEWKKLAKIGFLEEDLKTAYMYDDPADLKRIPKITLEAGYVYSGLGRLWEYLSRLAKEQVRTGAKELPLTLSDPEHKCVNLDITQYGDPAFMRIMRAPFSAHKKRIKVIPGAAPLVDVPIWHYDGFRKRGEMDFGYLIDCMWDLEKALEHSHQFTGSIPKANGGLVGLIEEYEHSALFQYHQEMDYQPDLERQEAFARAKADGRLNDKTRGMIEHPNPRALDPRSLIKLAHDLKENGWHPKHIGNLIADLYEQPQHGWNCDWMKYPSRTRGNFWARIYGF